MQLFSLTFIAFLFLACSVKQPKIEEVNQKTNVLEKVIAQLSAKISQKEAKILAKSSIDYSLKLAKKYEVISYPWVQNFLVNVGIKKRGLCYEWSEDLLTYLLKYPYRTISFHNIGANIGYLNEHNALAISAKGEGIERSIVLDAWRNSGNLYFGNIEEDRGYKWEKRVDLYKVLSP
ncbi:MAG: Unknown protein [uncultured Sulfurovum sp.]|uniref:Transglutaminase-like domain-containing protein n=1 Tax=uncultured Sulfurovum sp. TaxID=269237 RepID=A0A6S6SR69_9BACT|nr:MAG: Unknown protein [uncultured Sulfurovum sp.]